MTFVLVLQLIYKTVILLFILSLSYGKLIAKCEDHQQRCDVPRAIMSASSKREVHKEDILWGKI